MTAITLSRKTMTPMLPFNFHFDFDAASQAASDARMADRELCGRHVGHLSHLGRQLRQAGRPRQVDQLHCVHCRSCTPCCLSRTPPVPCSS